MSLFNKTNSTKDHNKAPVFKISSFGEGRLKNTAPPEDIIAPRILIPGETMVLGGARGVGKTDLLLNWLAHMSVGVPFLGMTPPRPLKVFYLQGANGYHYLCERIKNLQIEPELITSFRNNFFFSERLKNPFDKEEVDLMRRTVLYHMRDGVDIIAINPLSIFFDGSYADMDSYARVKDFERNRLEVLREGVNSKCGIILIHETKTPSQEQLKQDHFYGFNQVRSLSSCDISMSRLEGSSHRTLHFALNHGASIKPKLIDKIDGRWCEVGTAMAKKKAA